ncbi:hypothetical protein [Glycomyces sp. NPDC021274]|uniref:hypothetical protein n=1 Tax=Glycomyces sp. NPDC021274 TaxID=3155120 RepID=UPI0033EC25B6
MPMLYPRRSGRRTSPLALLLLGIPLVVLGAALLPVMLPSALAEERAYTAAPSCPDSVTAPDDAGECRKVWDATVIDKEVTGDGDNKRHFVTVDVDGDRYRVRLASGQSDIDEFDLGDQVTVTSWRHRIREIVTDDGASIRIAGTPIGAYKAPMMGSVALLAFGFSLLWTARFERRLQRSGRSIESTGSWTGTVPSLTAVVYAIIALAAVAAPAGLAGSLTALACTAVGTLLVGALLWRRARRKAERRSARLLSATWVSPATSGTVVPGRVMGEVPYSREGDNYLVIGPTGLAVASDPRGAAGRSRPLPPLTFVRLHPARKGDHRCGALQDPLFVECRDGAKEVLIAASREHVPWVLGGLRFRPQP